MKTKILVVGGSPDARTAYLKALAELGATGVCVTTLGDMRDHLLKEPCQGIVIDTRESVRPGPEKKRLLHLADTLYPVTRVRLAPDGKVLATAGGKGAGGNALHRFVELQCKPFRPRKLRASERMKIHFNVEVSTRKSLRKPARTFTVDVSPLGGYVFLADPPPERSAVFIRFAELSDATPVGARVVRALPWGGFPLRIPGAGLIFTSISKDQKREIAGTR